MAEKLTSIDAAARMSHRHLLAALGLVLLMGVAALQGGALWTLLPVIITITAAALYGMVKRVDPRALEAMRKDELRQASLQRAWRNGFFAMLGLQPALALALSWSGAANAVALMAGGAVTIGSATVLASLLWYDR
ncbi:hypothetical protein ACI48D_15755 [Massilia sp. LXY-6]|uniref:hypothetical protein n=1 Tax=Massilia sp. LXY-6 TaxID=3379823 RepID=UPI003EE3D05E